MIDRGGAPAPHLTAVAMLMVLAVFALTGCGQTSSPSPSTTAATTADATSSGAEHSPGSSAGDPERVLEAFFESVAAPSELSFHFIDSATLTVVGEPISAAGRRFELDIDGTSGSGEILLGAGGESVVFEIVFVGDDAWIRQPGGEWAPAEPSEVDPTYLWDVWRDLPDSDSFTFESKGPSLVHFVSDQSIPYVTATMSTVGADGSVVQTDLYLNLDGSPTRIGWKIEGETPLAGERVRVTIERTMTITAWGEPLAIEPPFD